MATVQICPGATDPPVNLMVFVGSGGGGGSRVGEPHEVEVPAAATCKPENGAPGKV